MASLLSAYEILNKGRSGLRSTSGESLYRMNKDVTQERRKEAREEARRADASGLGRLFGGTAGGLLASLITVANPLLGAVIAGAGAGLGSMAGKAVAGAQNQVGIGKWDVEAGREREDSYKDSILAGGLSDAVTGGLLHGIMPDILKTLGLDKISLATKFAQKNVPKNAYNLLSGMGI